MENTQDIHIGNIVKEKLAAEKRSVAWLAEKVYKDPSNLRKILKKKSMDIDLLQRISKALHHNFLNYYKDNS